MSQAHRDFVKYLRRDKIFTSTLKRGQAMVLPTISFCTRDKLKYGQWIYILMMQRICALNILNNVRRPLQHTGVMRGLAWVRSLACELPLPFIHGRFLLDSLPAASAQ